MYEGVKAGKKGTVEMKIDLQTLETLETQAELQSATLNEILNELTELNNNFKGLNKNFKKLNNNVGYMERAVRSQPIIIPWQQGAQLPMFQMHQSVQPPGNFLASILENLDVEKGLKTFEVIKSLFFHKSVDKNKDKNEDKNEDKTEDKE